ncbi:unnamed protein product [Phytomonas sp. EM1]|nr:unnamed protein product [Phytomonas sp. EM1]|eukprot:CCW62847.1 unnamed protein product [Phytomonas sp. isolate EM1]
MSSAGGIPPGVNMPKKPDPRLRKLQAPQTKQFFDSADYEVRRQREGAPQIVSQSQSQSMPKPNSQPPPRP